MAHYTEYRFFGVYTSACNILQYGDSLLKQASKRNFISSM